MNRADKFAGILVTFLGIMSVILAAQLPSAARKGIPGPALIPQLVGGTLVICGLVLFFQSFQKQNVSTIVFNRHSLARLTGVMVLIAASAVGLSYLGFIVSCLIVTFFFLILLGIQVMKAGVSALMITFSVYFLFHYGLQVQFPMGSVW